MTLHWNVSGRRFFITVCHQKSHPKGHFSVVFFLESYCTGHLVIFYPAETVFRSSSLNLKQGENPLETTLSIQSFPW